MIGHLVHQLERFTMVVFGGRSYGSLPRHGHGLNALVLARARRQARYFALGNAVRLVLLLPIIYSLQLGPVVPLYTAIFLAALHLLLGLVETYRYHFLMRLFPEEGPDEIHPVPPRPTHHWYYGPHAWESVGLYRWLGADIARKVHEAFVIWARGDRHPSYGPAEPEQPIGRQGIFRFLRQTRQAEMSHLFGLVTNLPLLIALLGNPSFALVGLGISIWVDSGIVVLQRQHRVRLRRVFMDRETA